MARVYVTRRTYFNAAHRLHNPKQSDAWNRNTFGKCNNPSGHGHNYTLEVTACGTPDERTGYVIDLSELKRIIDETILARCDHANLNEDVDFMEGILPSTENFVVAIWRELEKVLPPGCLHKVRLEETHHNSAEYHGE